MPAAEKSIINSIKKTIKNWFDLLPLNDKQYLQARYLFKFKRLPNLTTPKTFYEKLHWMNLNGHLDKYSSFADKYAVREYVAKKIGNQYLNELYGIYSDEKKIDFGKLPRKFVLKATHGSGWNIICKDKYKLDIDSTRSQLGKWLKSNYYQFHRERIYKNIPPRIICERLIEDEDHEDLIDYKILCFDGKLQFINVMFDRFTNRTGNYYDKNWKICSFRDDRFTSIILDKPKNFLEMKEIAETLAEGIPFVRIDLYNIKTTILFGEMTFFPNAGYAKMEPPEGDLILGALLHLPIEK